MCIEIVRRALLLAYLSLEIIIPIHYVVKGKFHISNHFSLITFTHVLKLKSLNATIKRSKSVDKKYRAVLESPFIEKGKMIHTITLWINMSRSEI